MKMNAAFLTGLRKVEVKSVEAPVIERDTDVLIKVLSVGVCGSDIHYFNEGRIGDQVVAFPFIVGHEMTGMVADVGKAVASVKKGDRVVVDPAISCNKCSQCGKKRYHTCSALKFLGCPGQKEGCLSEYLVMPEGCCYLLPDGLSDDDGVLCEPLSIGVYAWQLSGATADSSVGILGSGPIGLAVLASASDAGNRKVYSTDILDYRFGAALSLGAKWAGNPVRMNVPSEIRKYESDGLDVVFECSGTQQAIDEAIRLLTPGGKLVIVGIPTTDRISFRAHDARRLEISIVHVRRQNECVHRAIELMSRDNAKYGKIVTHHFSLEETAKAFGLVSGYSDGVIKAIIRM
jgi:L-iditol 2-dehydrogenase